MHQGYNHTTIWINNRILNLDDVMAGNEKARTTFEETTLSFIREWLSGAESFLLQTSGSTGIPKSLPITRSQMEGSALRTLSALQLVSGNTVLVCLPTQYIAGRMMLVRALVGNLHIVAVEPSADPWASIPDNLRIDFAACVPLQLETMLSSPAATERLNRLRCIVVGGAEVSIALHRKLQQLTVPVYATYGMTETISHIALKLLNTDRQESGFHPLPGVSVSVDERGCLIIRDTLLAEPVVTNDLIELYDDHSFHWIGRYDNIINTGGIKVSPEKLEQAILHETAWSQLARNYFIAGLPHPRLGHEVVWVVEGAALDKETERLLLDSLALTMQAYEVPKRFLYIPQFAYTPTGKINRKASLEAIVKPL